MSWASPERLIWLWVALPIIGFYILKTRLRRRHVATLLFWDQVFEEKRQRSLWQNLRHWLSLALQLLFVGLVVAALTDPLWTAQRESGQELILIVDNSASMQAVDPGSGRSRLQEAIEQANEVAIGLRQGDQIALITAGTSVRVTVGITDFAPAITEALDTIEPTDGPTRVAEAIEAARGLSDDLDRRRIVVFSDVCLPEGQELEVAEDLRWVQVGSSQDNAAITTFQARRSTVDPIGYALLIEVSNHSDQPLDTRLTLRLGESLVDVIPISLEADGRWRTTIEGTSREGGVLEATLDVEDALSIDNVARAVVPSRPLIPVTLVTQEENSSFYVRTVLESIPMIQLTVAEDFHSETADSQRALTVFSGVVPERLPKGPTLIVAVNADGPPVTDNQQPPSGAEAEAWKIGDTIDAPIIAKQEKSSPLLRHVQLTNVLLDGGRDIEVSESLGQPTTLLETAEGARVLVSVERASGRLLILAADLDTSDLPLRIAFPVMMTNAMNWFLRETGEMNPALGTGQVTTIPWDVAEESGGEAILVDEQGKRRSVTVDQSRALVGPLASIGVHGLFTPSTLPAIQTEDDTPSPSPQQLIEDDSIQGSLLAVNLCDARESDLRLPELAESEAGQPPPGGAPPWAYLVLVAIGLVVGEWFLFNRRIVA